MSNKLNVSILAGTAMMWI